MSLHAGWSSWWMVIMVMVFMGPMMRMIFGSHKRSRRWNYTGMRGVGLGDRGELERLETAINERDNVIEDLQQRLSEMESRLDFTERMLSERTPAGPMA